MAGNAQDKSFGQKLAKIEQQVRSIHFHTDHNATPSDGIINGYAWVSECFVEPCYCDNDTLAYAMSSSTATAFLGFCDIFNALTFMPSHAIRNFVNTHRNRVPHDYPPNVGDNNAIIEAAFKAYASFILMDQETIDKSSGSLSFEVINALTTIVDCLEE